MTKPGQTGGSDIARAEQNARFAVLLEVLDKKIDDQTADLEQRLEGLENRLGRLEKLVVTALFATIGQLIGVVLALLKLK